jgi:hypothetical protein
VFDDNGAGVDDADAVGRCDLQFRPLHPELPQPLLLTGALLGHDSPGPPE